jgi:hypothetical protein
VVFIVVRGWGFVVIAYLILALLGMNLLVDALFGPRTYDTVSAWSALAVGLAGVATIVTGRHLNHGPVPLIPRADGQLFSPLLPFLFAPHSFVFIPIEAWGALEVVAAMVSLVRTAFHL